MPAATPAEGDLCIVKAMAPDGKRLILYRHAKSDWPEGVEDHARPLAGRGRVAAPKMGRYLADNGLVPDLALVSSAQRTQETWALTAKATEVKIAARTVAAIYEATALRLLDVIRANTADIATLMIVGHNPGLQELAELLMLDDGGEAGERLRQKFPTAAVAVLDFRITRWADLSPGAATLERFVTPKSNA
jgi:phosphohistidine phosphatase